MIDIKTFKKELERGSTYHKLLIIVYSDNQFVARQYVRQIAKNNNVSCNYVEDIDSLLSTIGNIFDDSCLNVLVVDKLSIDTTFLSKVKDAVIITNKIDKETSKLFDEYILEIPKLESWQIEDYASTLLSGVKDEDVRSLVHACDNDIYRVESEVAKLSIFNESRRQYMFQSLTESGLFPTTEKYTIFSLSNALLTKSSKDVESILSHIEEIDINPIALLSIMYKNVANVIAVQFGANSLPESLGMSSGQFYAIKKNNINFYTRDQLIKILEFLTSLDLKIKSGELPTNLIISYIVTYMLEIQ